MHSMSDGSQYFYLKWFRRKQKQNILGEILLRNIFMYLLYTWVKVIVIQSCPDSLRPRGLYPARLLCPWGFCRQEYWSGLPFPSPGDLPIPGIEPGSPSLQADSLPSEPRYTITERPKIRKKIIQSQMKQHW